MIYLTELLEVVVRTMMVHQLCLGALWSAVAVAAVAAGPPPPPSPCTAALKTACGAALAGWGAIPGALGGCAVGGFLGYWAGETVTGYAYDWAEGTIFTAATEVPAP